MPVLASSCSPIQREVRYLRCGSRRAPIALTRTTDFAPAALAASPFTSCARLKCASERLRLIATHGDEADDVLHPLGGLSDRDGVQRIARNHLRAADLESRRLHRVADEHPELVTAVDQLVRDAATKESGRAQQKNPGHGSRS